MRRAAAALMLLLALPVHAGIEARSFPDPALEARYQHLIANLRCLVCQNESLAASNADLASDLRQEVYEQLLAGRDDQAIIRYLVDRYGDFVLYRPPLKPTTVLLWYGPWLLLLAGLLAAWRLLRRRQAVVVDPAARERARRLLDGDPPEAP